MKNYRIAAFCIVALFAASCGKTAKFSGVVTGAADDKIVVKLLDVNRYTLLDTLKTDADGFFSYKMAVEKGQPEFVYLFKDDVKIASMILQEGDRITIEADTKGNYTVEGSEESSRLLEVENKFASFAKNFVAVSNKIENEDLSESEFKSLQQEMGKIYIDYYRDVTRYVLQNPTSLTVVPVLYQSVNEYFPIFSQDTDAILFKNVSDSLKTIYPDSRYVKALAKEAQRRANILNLNSKFSGAQTLGYPDIDLPDIYGNKIKLSSVEKKVVLIHFWTAEDNSHKMFILDVLKPLYEKYHDKGFEIYAVCTDVDKALWASVVKNQGLPWINVCDALGGTSQAAISYGVNQVPASFLLVEGALVDTSIKGENELRNYLDKTLK